MSAEELKDLIRTLVALPDEVEWVEFKVNNDKPDEIGDYISAIANSAALHGKPAGYIVWGIEDRTHTIVGTSFRPRQTKIGNEELENWLARLLTPRIDFRIHELDSESKHLVLFEIPPASHMPVRFGDNEFIRVGSYKKKLKDHPDKERALWGLFSKVHFEKELAVRSVTSDQVLSLLDYPAYFELTSQSLPDNRTGILERLTAEKMIIPASGGKFHITNLGAILFAKDLDAFEGLKRKAVRVIAYKGANRVETLREQTGRKGYASGFEGLISFVSTQLPHNEHIGKALRMEQPMYPEKAIRELVANAIIHQDFRSTGTGPMVEIFSDRIELTNPGTPLIDTLRFIDAPPQSRNDALAAFMRRLNICEERGSGIDKVVFYVELFQLPAPDFMVTENHTKVILFAPKSLAEMSKKDRIRACYQHAALQYVSNQQMTNASLRKRFSISAQNAAIASRIIAETLEEGLVKSADPENRSRKHATYIPFWA